VKVCAYFAVLLLASALGAQVAVYPLRDVQPGLQGTGRTVFAGDRVEEFQVEVLGVLENTGPKQSVILARLSGGPLEHTGVLQGMSGSPVYVDGKLMGAVALAFPLTREPIAGIRPIEEMLRTGAPPPNLSASSGVSLWDRDLTKLFARRQEVSAGGSRLVEIATPVSFGGFTRRTIEQFTPQLREIGLEPAQGMSGGGTASSELGAAGSIEPGSMISVLLLSGDMNVGADGTVTHIDGERLYAFGHRFLSVGSTSLPFARSEVITLAPNLATSFKISTSREMAGTITADHSTAVQGVLGKKAALAPISITVRGPSGAGSAGRLSSYRMEMVNDRFLSPFLLQMALYSAIDATERTVGASTVSVRGRIEFTDGAPPVRLDEMYAGDGNIPLQASLGAAIPTAYLLQSGFETLRMSSVSLDVEVFNERRQWVIDDIIPQRRTVRPGESVELTVLLTGENGAEMTRKFLYDVPAGAPAGALNFTVSDAAITNMIEYMHLAGQRMRSPEQVVKLLNELRNNTGAYVRVWRSGRTYRVQDRSLPSPPASIAMILQNGQPAASGAIGSYSSKVAEIPIEFGDSVVAGSKTTQVEVKE